MKKILLSMILLCVAAVASRAQTVNMTFSITNGTPLVLPVSGASVSVGFTVQLSKPTSMVANGNFTVEALPSGGSTSSSLTGLYGVSWSSSQGVDSYQGTGSFNINSGQVNNGDGTMFVKFVTSTGGVHQSNSIAVRIQITNNTISGGGNFVTTTDPPSIPGSTPQGGHQGSFTYQWQSGATSGGTFTNITGATSRDYDPGTISATTYYRRNAISGASTNSSNAIGFLKWPAISGNSISTSGLVTFESSGNPSIINGSTPTGGTGSYNYQWQSCTTGNLVDFSNIPGQTSQNYDPTTISQTTYYRRVVNSGGILSFSEQVVITVLPPISNNTISNYGPGGFDESGDPSTLNGSSPSGANGTYTYQWEIAHNAPSGFSEISGATSQSYDPPTILVSTFYRRIVYSSVVSTPSTSNVIGIYISKIGATMQNPIILADLGMCNSRGGGQSVHPIWGDDNANGVIDVYYKFNLTALGKLRFDNCTSSGTGNSAILLDQAGNPVSGGTLATEVCDVGGIVEYFNLPVGTYYVVIEPGNQYTTSMVFGLYLEPILNVSSDVTILAGASTTLTASGTGVNTYSWSPSTGLNTATGTSVVASPLSTTYYSVTGSSSNGCSVYKTVKVTVTGSIGSTINNPIVMDITGCGYSGGVESNGYGNEYGLPSHDVFYKFTLTSSSPVLFTAFANMGQGIYGDFTRLVLLNSLGEYISEKTFGWIDTGEDVGFPYIWGPLDFVNYNPTLSAGTYYLVVEGVYSNVAFGITVDTPSGYSCRKTAPNWAGYYSPEKYSATEEEPGGLLLSPIPASDFVLVTLSINSPSVISISDSNGKIVKTTHLQRSGRIDVSDLSAGLYVVRFDQKDKRITKKLVITR